MIRVRKGAVLLLSLILLVSLLVGAFSVSANVNFAHPEKVETWLKQSNFYNSVVTDELHKAQQTASNDQGAGRVSLSDTAVEQAVHTVFSAQLLQGDASTFLNSNYAWLEGKTSTPEFKIDLTSAKQRLGQAVGQQVQARLSTLPACSVTQLAQLASTLESDPLAIPCLPPTLTPQTAAAQASAQISGSSDFLNNSVLTAQALNPSGSNQGRPYYQKLAKLPRLYRLNRKLPWIAGGIALICILGILVVSLSRRRGVRRLIWVFGLAGLLLIISTFAADGVFHEAEKKVLNTSVLDQLQTSLTDFLHRAVTQFNTVNAYFAIVYLGAALVLLGILWLTRSKAKGGRSDSRESVAPGLVGSPGRPPLPVLKPQTPQRPKRPRLIQ